MILSQLFNTLITLKQEIDWRIKIFLKIFCPTIIFIIGWAVLINDVMNLRQEKP